MRILALCFEDVYHTTGGMGVHCRDLYRAIGAQGHEVRIVSIASQPPAYGVFQLAPNVEVLKIEQKLTYLSNLPMIQHFLFEQNFLMNALERYGREKFDVIHIHDSHLWSVAESLRLLWKIPIVLTCHLSPLLHEMRFSQDLLAQYKDQVEGTAICNADAIISVSRYYHDELKSSIFGVDSVIIHNGIDVEALRPYRREESVHSAYAGAEPLVVMVGRPVPNKGIKALMEASARLPERRFVLVGWLPQTVERHYPLAAEVLEHQAQHPNFRWLRDLPHHEKFRLMASADVGIVPSLYEPFGIVALEWMALGVPLITTGVGGLGEFCHAGNCDLHEPAGEALAAAISTHVRSESKIRAGRVTADSFAWDRAAAATIKVYKETTRCPP